LKRVSLELGGKSPNIVFPDADQPLAVRNAMNGVFYNSGQVCAAGTRIFVQRDIYDNFVADLTTASERMTLGDPLDPKTRLGPVVSREQFDKVTNLLRRQATRGLFSYTQRYLLWPKLFVSFMTIRLTDILRRTLVTTCPEIDQYPGGQTVPTPKAIDFKPGALLGSVFRRTRPARISGK
jgi:delta 1-pyrroline-5-carboxylate dehydrogenase